MSTASCDTPLISCPNMIANGLSGILNFSSEFAFSVCSIAITCDPFSFRLVITSIALLAYSHSTDFVEPKAAFLISLFGGVEVIPHNIILSKLILPKISNNIEARKSQILENIETAEKQRADSENKIKEYEKIISESKIEAKNYFNEAREKILKDIEIKREALEKEINNEINDAEKEIIELKNTSVEKINKIAIETTSDLVENFLETDVNKSNISAVVEDLYKKNKDKYHGV